MKKFVERGRPQMTVWRICIACWVTKSTHTLAATMVARLSVYVALSFCFFLVLQELLITVCHLQVEYKLRKVMEGVCNVIRRRWMIMSRFITLKGKTTDFSYKPST